MRTTVIAGKTTRRMGFGCFPLTGGYGGVERGVGVRMIQAALDAGIGLLDTSDAYAAGANESVVGEAVRGRRDAAIIATKFGWILNADGVAVRLDSSAAHVRQACEASLRRLRTDHIDVYIQHRVDPKVHIEETMGELSRLLEEGKIRAIGLSEAAVATIHRAHAVHPVAMLQTEYSLWSLEPEAEQLPQCSALGIGFTAYSPLGRGFLAGGIRNAQEITTGDFRRSHPRFQAENISRNLVLVDRLGAIARELGCTVAQLSLAWLLAQPWGVIPIPATTREEHLTENLKALDLRLSSDDMRAIREALPAGSVHGERHPAEHMTTINR